MCILLIAFNDPYLHFASLFKCVSSTLLTFLRCSLGRPGFQLLQFRCIPCCCRKQNTQIGRKHSVSTSALYPILLGALGFSLSLSLSLSPSPSLPTYLSSLHLSLSPSLSPSLSSSLILSLSQSLSLSLSFSIYPSVPIYPFICLSALSYSVIILSLPLGASLTCITRDLQFI